MEAIVKAACLQICANFHENFDVFECVILWRNSNWSNLHIINGSYKPHKLPKSCQNMHKKP
jgi:hypothetical protein